MIPNRPPAAVTLAFAFAAIVATSGQAQMSDAATRSCGLVLDQEVCTWVRMEGGKVAELGASIPLALVEKVPLDAEMTWPPAQMASIRLPEQARKGLGIDHLGINWEAHGHPPGPFLTPHFDFHFYSVTGGQLDALDCADESKPATLPRGYILPDIEAPGLGMLHGLCVPKMGMHAMPVDDIEAETPFTATMVMGYYGGMPIFLEPMVSRARLLERSSFTLPVPSVELPKGVRYPKDFAAEYDATKDRYLLVLRDFSER